MSIIIISLKSKYSLVGWVFLLKQSKSIIAHQNMINEFNKPLQSPFQDYIYNFPLIELLQQSFSAYQKQEIQLMEKHTWNKVHCNLKSSSHPSSRWGHSCCQIADTIVFFGGYADSTYMNDIWTFNTLTMDWTQIQTKGDVPSHRSNCSMCYDQKNNRIVLFGGGAPNKKRFNSIHLLDWTTKQWTQINPVQNQQAPWQRTYHTAQLFYPYLIVFGGEGMTDMDDVWAFNFQTLSWKQITVDSQGPKPCARRFHSSVKIGNQFYIIAGCHGKYRCLSDIYSMDVSDLLKKGSTTLKWKQNKVKGSTFLTRWGHSSVVYDGKIYIFGGRFSNDLNDILVVDLQKQTMRAMKTNIELPKARRRHSACFVGSNMVIFGGFNGQYFNDLHYINVFQLKKKFDAKTQKSLSKANYIGYLNSQLFKDGDLLSCDEQQIPIHKALIRKNFSSQIKMQQFLMQMSTNYSKSQILQILSYLYKGCNKQDFQSRYLSLAQNYEIQLCQNETEKQIQFFKKLFYQSRDFMSIVPKKSSALNAPVIYLSEDQYINFLQIMRTQIYCDASIVFNRQYCLPVSKCLLKMNSSYFNNLFTDKFSLTNDEIHLPFQCSKTLIVVYEVLINYILLGRIVTSKQFGFQHWTELIQLAEYYSLQHLKKVCEQQLFMYANQNCQKLMNLSLMLNLKRLGMFCADYQIKMMVNKQDKYQIQYNESDNQKLNQKRQQLLKQVYGLLRFDILQGRIQLENQAQFNYKKKEGLVQQKENYQNNMPV